MEKSATNTGRAGNLIGKNLMDYRKGGGISLMSVSFRFLFTRRGEGGYVHRLILVTGMVASQVGALCLLSKTDIFACKVAERQAPEKGGGKILT